jgi:hypothetical protein
MSLDSQVIARVRQFLQSSNVNQRQLAGAIGADSANFNSWLSGTKGLAVTKMAKLLAILGMNQMQLAAKFNGPSVMARFAHVQTLNGIKLDDSGGSWVSGDPSGGTDPNDSSDDEQRLLEEIAGLHQVILDKINAFQAKAKPNPRGVTEGPRRVNGNAPAGGGSRDDLLSVTPAQVLAHIEKERKNAETALAIQKKINEERKKRLAAQIELADARKESLFDTK